MKYFKIEDNCLIPINMEWYWIPINELIKLNTDGIYHWFNHLADKNWFTEDMLMELAEFAKSKFPFMDSHKAVYQAAFKLGQKSNFN